MNDYRLPLPVSAHSLCIHWRPWDFCHPLDTLLLGAETSVEQPQGTWCAQSFSHPLTLPIVALKYPSRLDAVVDGSSRQCWSTIAGIRQFASQLVHTHDEERTRNEQENVKMIVQSPMIMCEMLMLMLM